MDFKTMGQTEVDVKKLNEPERIKQIHIVQGNLDDKSLRQLPKINGTILVTGNVFFVESSTTVPCGLFVLGDLYAQRAFVHGSLTVCGHVEAERLIVHGDTCIETEAKLKELLSVGEKIPI